MIDQDTLKKIRTQYFSSRKVICTGNPLKENTIASGIKKLYPEATFLCRSTGWDLQNLTPDKISQLKSQFKQHNTFINASYIAPGVQTSLLELCNQSAKHYEVVNIGSTHEYDGLGHEIYTQSKNLLREKSLSLNTFRFETHHVVVGGIKKHDTPNAQHWISIDEICQTIQWVIGQDHRLKIPMIVIDQPKQPW
jgi:NADP-dependent 3-hydroxy acid dehydrogenase YdfG